MAETKNPGDKLTVSPTKTLTLKRGAASSRALCARVSAMAAPSRSSSRRSRSAACRVKADRRRLGPQKRRRRRSRRDRRARRPRPPAARPARHPPPRNTGGVLLRTLTEEERNARATALANSRVRDVEERKIAEEEAARRASRDAVEQAERDAAEARKKAEEDRHRHEDEAKKKAELEAKKRFGDEETRTARTAPAAPRPPVAVTEPDDDEGPRQVRRGPGGAARPAVAPKVATTPPGGREAARPPDTGHRADRRRSARALDRIVPPAHPAPERPSQRRAEGKADPRGDNSGSDHNSRARQPHVGARGRRDPPADEAGPDGEDHRRDRRRHRPAGRRGNGPQRQARRRSPTSRKVCSTSPTIMPPTRYRARLSSP